MWDWVDSDNERYILSLALTNGGKFGEQCPWLYKRLAVSVEEELHVRVSPWDWRLRPPAGRCPSVISTLADCAQSDTSALAPMVCLSNGSSPTWKRESHLPWTCICLSVPKMTFACSDLGSLSHSAFYYIKWVVLKPSLGTKSKQEKKTCHFVSLETHYFKVTNTSVKTNHRTMIQRACVLVAPVSLVVFDFHARWNSLWKFFLKGVCLCP